MRTLLGKLFLCFIFLSTQVKAQTCFNTSNVITGGVCSMYNITPVSQGQTVTECFLFKPETQIIHLNYMLAQGSNCGPTQYSSLQVYIWDTACTSLEHYANVHPTQSNIDAVLDTSKWYYMCLRFTASCTITAICAQYNLSYLPITLEYFNAELDGTSVLVQWKTSEEMNLDHYVVQRADSNFVFRDIYKRYRPVYEDIEKYYTYIDELPPSGVVYYRLKEVDIDGCITVFDPVSVKVPGRIILNPLEFYDILGRKIRQNEEN